MSLVVDGKTYKLPADIPTVASLANGPYQLALRTVKASKALNMWAGLLEQARTRLAPGLAATVAPPVERNARWNSIKGIETPFGANHGATDSKQFGYWFNYFWTEAREAYDLNPAAQAQLCDAFFAVLEADGNGGYRPTDRYAAMDNTQMQNVLLKVLRVGFKRVHVGEQKKGPFSAPQALDAKSMFALQVSGNGEARRTLPIGFRGDNRKPGDLKDGGFMARARSLKSTVHSNYGMNQAWHPFNLPVYANSLFLRKGKSKDNCLHTVISVASSLEEMLPYPLLSDPSLFGLAFKDPATWTSDDVNYVKNHWLGSQIVRDSEPNGRIDKLTTTKNIYILNMGLGQAFDTQAWQQSL
nr:hypothetical protein [Bryobacterales bacterium]